MSGSNPIDVTKPIEELETTGISYEKKMVLLLMRGIGRQPKTH